MLAEHELNIAPETHQVRRNVSTKWLGIAPLKTGKLKKTQIKKMSTRPTHILVCVSLVDS